MAKRNVIKEGDKILRKNSRVVTKFDAKLHELIDDLWETMYDSDGVGLAAPQVAILKRVAVVDTMEGDKVELVNPIIVEKNGEQIGLEGCLSIPGFTCKVKRPQKIKVKAVDRNGKLFSFVAEDFFAVACCHEIDHLNGILFRDREYIEPKER